MEDENVIRVPRYFINRYLKEVPDFIPEKNIMNAIRVNTLKITVSELLNKLEKRRIKLKKISFLKNGYIYESDFSLGSTIEYLKGFYYIQEAASQIPVEVLNVSEKDIVLDMCAAPGSKTTQLSMEMNNKGKIVALDKDVRRLNSLMNNLERCGVKNVIVYNKDGRFVSDLGLKFDKILLDAPCSGNYCIEEDFFFKRSRDDFLNKNKVQKELLKAGVGVLKKGGEIVYSTCSLEIEEDQEVVEYGVKELGLKLVDFSFDGEIVKGFKKFFPYKDKMQGFFVAKMKKT